MGIVRKQSAYSTIFIYIGFAVGAVNLLVLLPRIHNEDAAGLTRMITDVAVFFTAFATLGSINTLYKFYPFYNSYLEPKKNDLPFLTVVANLTGCVLFLIASFVFKNLIARKFGAHSPLFVAHYYLIIPFTISYICLALMESFCWIIKKTIMSNIAREVVFRLTSSVLILLYLFKIISVNTFLSLFSFVYVPSLLFLLYVIFKDGTIRICTKISTLTKRVYKRVLAFLCIHYSGMLISIIPGTVDGILLAGMSDNGLEKVFKYTMAVFLASVIDVPQRSVAAIATPLIAEAWRNKNVAKIRELYQKTSLNLLILGFGLFCIIYLNIDNLIRFEGSGYEMLKPVFLIIGIGRVIDLGMGMNAQILTLSQYWMFDFYTSVAFIFVNVILDFIMIKLFGPIGAAYGRTIALIFYNAIRYFYLYKFYRLQPFSFKTLMVIGFGAIAFFVVHLIPHLGNIFSDTAARVAAFALLFALPVLSMKISEDINAMYRNAVNKLLRK